MNTTQVRQLPIHSDPEILGGKPVFVGTRVPVRTVFDYMADGCSLEVFLEEFPTVSRTDAIKVLEAGGTCLSDLVQSS
jgi:uncharacterized protein (DUF433 family)